MMKKSVGIVVLLLGMTSSAVAEDVFGFGADTATSSVVATEEPMRQPRVVDQSKFIVRAISPFKLPSPDQTGPVHVVVKGVPAFESMLHELLRGKGYVLAETPGPGITTLQLTGDFKAEGKFDPEGQLRTSWIDFAIVLGGEGAVSDASAKRKDQGKQGPSALSQVGRDLATNYRSLQITGGSLAGSLGLQAGVAAIFDLTGLTGLIRRTHTPDNPYSFCAMFSADCKAKRDDYDKPRQVVYLWVNYKPADEATRSFQVEATYTDSLIAAPALIGAALDSALMNLGVVQ